METLTLQDVLNAPVEVEEVVFLGKQAFIRGLSFDAQMNIYDRFSGEGEKEANGADMAYMIGCVLCDETGNLLFEDPDDAAKALGRLKAEDLLSLFDSIQAANALDLEAATKK